MSIEAMKQALEALENAISDDKPYILKSKEAITALRQAIEQAEKQEGWVLREVYFSEGEPISHREPQPVAWANKKGQFKVHKEADETFKSTAIPFYAAPVHARPVAQCSYPKCQATNGCVGACFKTAPVHASDTNQKRVDETGKGRHEWVGLTHEELAWLNEALNLGGRFAVIEAIEAKIKEKNHDRS